MLSPYLAVPLDPAGIRGFAAEAGRPKVPSARGRWPYLIAALAPTMTHDQVADALALREELGLWTAEPAGSRG